MSLDRVLEIPGGIKVLGVTFHAFVDPKTNQAVFSQSEVARELNISITTFRDIVTSERFKLLRGESERLAKLITTEDSEPISVITPTELVLLVQIAAEKGSIVARAIRDNSFAIFFKQSVDEALSINQEHKEDKDSSSKMKNTVMPRRFGCGKGIFTHVAEDFDATPPGFEEYMLP